MLTMEGIKQKEEAESDDRDYSKLETLLQLRMRSRNERTITRLPNGEYLAECNTCDAGTVFEYYEDAVIALQRT